MFLFYDFRSIRLSILPFTENPKTIHLLIINLRYFPMQYFGNFLGITRHDQKNRRQIVYISFFLCFFLFVLSICSNCFAQNGPSYKDAQGIIKRSVLTIKDLKTIECNLRMSVWVDDMEYLARGRYEEQAVLGVRNDDFLRSMYRLDINFISDVPLAPGTDPNRMTVVCHISRDRDKSQIWQYMSIEEKKELRIIRIPRLENAIRQSAKGQQYFSIGEVRNLGGMAGVLRQIDRFYEFAVAPIKERLEGSESVAVWKLTGTVRKEHYDALLKQFGGLGKKGKLPSDFPSDIELYVGQDDFFPYKIRYLNRPMESSKKRLPLSETSYFNVILNGEEIPEGNFALFNENGEYPEGVFDFQDDTTRFIQSLGL